MTKNYLVTGGAGFIGSNYVHRLVSRGEKVTVFDNLSRGERTRLTLSLSWAFRDVFESMNSGVNLMFVDELLDTGLDTSGVESSLGILKRMSIESAKSVFLISHREELIGRVSNVLKVTKEKGFTSLSMS